MSNAKIFLRGIAWNHTRGFLPVVATAQRFEELHPEVAILWEKRSLQSFADAAMVDLAAAFDLIIMDHPHTALAATQGLVLSFDDWLAADVLTDLAANSVGASHESYRYQGKQWGLAIDAAAPISTCRLDLFDLYGIELPRSWSDVIRLAEQGYVTVAAFPVDLLMHSYMFCDALGTTPFAGADCVAPDNVLAAAMAEIQRLVSLCDPACLERNPIRTAEWMAAADEPRAAYCPFAYGYSNYSRPGYAKHQLKAAGLVAFDGRRLRSTLGGAGLAISANTKYSHVCMRYAQFSASSEVQKGIYFSSGGQPGHRAAWNDDAVNAASLNFFSDTLQTLDEALLRGRFPGYMRFQDEGTPIVDRCVRGALKPDVAAKSLNRLYRDCFSSSAIN